MALHWRPLWRSFTTALYVALVLGAFLLFVWFTLNPDSPAVDRAREWPYLGPWIGRLQDRWRPPPVTVPTGESGAPEVIVRYYPTHPPPRDYIWVAGGTALRATPSSTAEPVAIVEETTNLFFHERRGDWVKVHRGAVEGWVLSPPGSGLAGRRDDRPEPVRPLPGRPPDPERLRLSLQIFSSPPVVDRLDPYLLYTDAGGEGVGPRCRDLVAEAEARWEARYGAATVGEAEEAILLFADREGYESFAELVEGGPMPSGTTGHAALGLVATYSGERSPIEICRSLLHEIAHLLARRSLGPGLPPWLGEGLAVDFTEALLEEVPAFAVVARAVRSGSAPSLVSLLDLGPEAFHAASRGLRYSMSGLLVRYLLTDADLAPGFRSFLAYLSRGGPWARDLGEGDFPAIRATPTLSDDLRLFLAQDAERLEAGFRAWLWARGGG